jgi:shikimate 5-dehydrogenase
MAFIGVSTAQSSIMRVFPCWAQLLEIQAELVGVDIPLDAPSERYRAVLRELRDDPHCSGALVTTHKIALHDAACDLFDTLDEFATACGEISSVVVRHGLLRGAAKDPIAAGKSLEEILAGDHFSTGAEVMCLGAGGAGTAIGWYVSARLDRPTRMTFLDTRHDRLAHLAAVVGPRVPDGTLRTGLLPEFDLTTTLAGLPPGSLVVNATGMGKDRPGSPLPAGATFPHHAVVWELNYRGDLDFLQQARAQQRSRKLRIADGWRYFIHGWTQVMSDVFDITLTADLLARLSQAAEGAR